jgi:hypothetical protein
LGHRSGSGQPGPGRVGFWVEYCRDFLDFRSFQAGSGFEFLVAQVISGFRSFESGSGQVSSHLISDSLELWVISGQVGFFFVMFYFGLGRISSWVEFRVGLSIML